MTLILGERIDNEMSLEREKFDGIFSFESLES
jgi:hypothetical protein